MTNHDKTAAERMARQTEYTFYPTVRRGYRPTSTFDGSTDVADPGSLGVELTVRGSGENGDRTETASVSLRMYGPGDVIGLDRRQVVRVEPSENSDGFPPNQFPHIEFVRPDLPWLFSPQRADDSGRNRPWLALVCVERDRDAVRLDPPGTGPLPVLETPVAELPNPAESWAWAHAQVTGTHDPDDELARTSDRTISRLVCPRNLDDATAYVACVVPTFETGRRAGLGTSVGADETDPDGNHLSLAWETDGDRIVRLPVYYSWEFRTGLEGDFESLVRELESVELGPDVGYRTIDVGDPGPDILTIPADDDDATVSLGGALKSADAVGDAYGNDHQEAFRTLLNVPEGIDEAAGSSIVGPPKYGQWHAGARTIEPPPTAPEGDDDSEAYPAWLHTLNTDPQYRVAAALGAETVRHRQEELMASAWGQAGDLRELNDRLRGMQLGRSGVARNHAHLGDVRPEALLQFTAPAQDRMAVSTAELPANHVLADSTTGFVTLRTVLARTALPDGATSPAFRRLTRSNGPLARRATASFDADDVVQALVTNRAPSVTLDGLDRRVRLEDAMSDEGQRAAEEAVDAGVATEESLVEALSDAAAADADVASDVRFLPDHRRASATESTPAWLTDDRGEAMTVAEAEVFHAERADAEGDHLLVARTVSRVRSAMKQALLARARVLDLRLALCGEESDGQTAAPPARVVEDSQILVAESERIRSDSLADLKQFLPDLAADPRPEGIATALTPDRTAELVDRLRTTHDELMIAAEAVRSALRSDDLDRKSVLASLDAADEHLASILEALETIDDYVETGPAAPRPSAAAEAAVAVTTPTTESVSESHSQGIGRKALWDDEDLALNLTTVQDGISSQLDPTAELAQLAADLSGIPKLRDREDPIAEVLARPTFLEPMFRSLAELDPEYLLPGVGSIPKNSIGALVTNPRFVEAYMAGLNHEMACELTWRRFPTDRRRTYFSQFWDHGGNPAAGAADTADVDPIHEWDGNDLGENGPGRRPDDDSDAADERAAKDKDDGATDDGMVVLLIRGEVLRRYPDTTVYAVKAVEDDGDRVPALPNTHVSRRSGLTDDDRLAAARMMDHDHLRGPWIPPSRPIEPEPHPPIDPHPEPPDQGDSRPPFDPTPPNVPEPTPPGDGEPQPPDVTEPIGPPETPAPQPDVKYPVFRGTIEPDITFLGFDLSVAEAVAGPYHKGGPQEGVSHATEDEGWFFVLEEAPGETRFGLDEDQGDVGDRPYGITFTSGRVRETRQLTTRAEQEGAEVGWSALSWGHLVTDDGGDGVTDPAAAISHVSVADSRPGSEQWAVEAGVRYHVGEDDEWTSADAAEWGANAAHMARITWQQPVRVAIHAADIPPDTEAQTSDGEDEMMTDTDTDGDGR
ncbi:hypothetical protein [Haladaptatus halobius]|uniref:hypothetical protein n=1 Tax=Haladaptatus halobius TaxID=2884875 RepID=UPI001D0B374E|nr:hypothetical protein [Haladaptatus halobius]